MKENLYPQLMIAEMMNKVNFMDFSFTRYLIMTDQDQCRRTLYKPVLSQYLHVEIFRIYDFFVFKDILKKS